MRLGNGAIRFFDPKKNGTLKKRAVKKLQSSVLNQYFKLI
jgi:hypothetical protein